MLILVTKSGFFPETAFHILVCGVILAVCSTEESVSPGLQRLKRQYVSGGVCEIPEPLHNGTYKPSYRRCPPGNKSPACKLLPGAYVPTDWVLHFTCDKDYVLSTSMTVAVCLNGQWVPDLPVCNKQSTPEFTCKQFDPMTVCTKLSQCPKAQLDLKRGVSSALCDVEGSEPSVCCELQYIYLNTSTQNNPKLRISAQKCQEYERKLPVGRQELDKLIEEVFVGTSSDKTDGLINDVMDTDSYEFPHMVIIGHRVLNDIRWRCEGSLISERFVLTTAFCAAKKSGLSSEEVLVKFGGEERVYEVVETFVHPEYNSSYYNNIALFKLKDEVNFNDTIRPICLQGENTLTTNYAIATGMYQLAGEESDVPKKINMTIVRRYECDQSYKDFRGTFKNGIIDTTMICAKELKRRDFSCGSYDGGALQTRRGDDRLMNLVGILSYGRLCIKHLPWVYERVSTHVPWIESIVWP